MTFLPIVERELRVTARRPATHRFRFVFGAVLCLIWLFLAFTARRGISSAQLAFYLLSALSIPAFCFCLLAGVFLTADCLSAEKREGTLGLLFLTDLKGYDVVLGKLAATSLNACYGLLGLIPMLALPLLLGGVTAAQFGRLVLTLLTTLFLSLTLGLGVSAWCRDTRQTMAVTFFVLMTLTGILPTFWWLQRIFCHATFFDWVCLWPSPAHAFLQASRDSLVGRGWPPDLAASLLTLTAIGTLALCFAIWTLPKSWQEKAATPARPRKPVEAAASALARSPSGWREQALAGNPCYWLSSRKPLPAATWIVFGLVLLIWLAAMVGTFLPRRQHEAFMICFFSAYGLHLIYKCLLAIEASRRLSEDRASGALELLLVTPVSQQEILRGQARALRERFLWPRRVLLLVNVLIGFLVVVLNPLKFDSDDKGEMTAMLFGGTVLLFFDSHLLIKTGMWMALRTARHHRAVLATLARVLMPSWLAAFLFILWGMVGNLNSRGEPETLLFVWFMVGGVNDLIVLGQSTRALGLDLRRWFDSPGAIHETAGSPGLVPQPLPAKINSPVS